MSRSSGFRSRSGSPESVSPRVEGHQQAQPDSPKWRIVAPGPVDITLLGLQVEVNDAFWRA